MFQDSGSETNQVKTALEVSINYLTNSYDFLVVGSSGISDPINLASYLFTNVKLVEEMANEIRDSLGDDADEIIEAQLNEGFRGIETEGVSFVVEKLVKFKLLIALFYDSDTFDRKIAEKL
jgi:hypothetical protein